MHQGLRHHLKHILQRADASEDHGHIQDDGEELTHGDVLQDGGQGHEQQAGTGAHVQTVGEAGGDNNQGGYHGGNGVKEGRVLGHAHHILVLGEVRTVNDHAAAGDGQGEECLTHSPDPDHGIRQGLPAGGEHKDISLRSAGQKGHPHGQNQEDHKEDRHHDLVGLFDAAGAQKQRQQRAHHHNDMIGNHRVGGGGKRAEPGGGVCGQQCAQQGIHQSLEHIGDDDGIADGDAQGASQRQPAQQTADFTGRLAAGVPSVFVSAQRTGGGTAAHGKLRRKAHITENKNKQQINQ